MKSRIRVRLRRAKRSLERRLRVSVGEDDVRPVLSNGSVKYDFGVRKRAMPCGGIGGMHQVAVQSGLVSSLNKHVRVLKQHRPYHESDHVLVHAYNIASGGSAIEHIKYLREDEAFLDALGAKSLPHPTTAGDFCRRFEEKDIVQLHRATDEARGEVWSQQDEGFFEIARLDVDGTVVETAGECKEGIGLSYKGLWGYQPFLVTLANTREPLRLINQAGNDNSVEAAGEALDEQAKACREAGFRDILMRGDTAFSFATRLDGWDDEDFRFIFGYSAHKNLKSRAQKKAEYEKLRRRAKRVIESEKERAKQPRVKERIIKEKGYKNLILESEYITEFDYRPTACDRDYRVVVLRKDIRVEKGGKVVGRETRYLFYITNDRDLSREQVVYEANDRCDQENIIEQLKHIRALHAPVNTLLANWAYMLMASLAWTLKAWMALLLPISPRWRDRHRQQRTRWLTMDFSTFRKAVILIPAQILRHARQRVFRFLAWRPQLHVLFRLLDAL